MRQHRLGSDRQTQRMLNEAQRRVRKELFREIRERANRYGYKSIASAKRHGWVPRRDVPQ